jgi:hypothetical protein
VPYDVPCVFQIWRKGELRKPQRPDTPIGFEYTNSNYGNVCVRRVGYYAGKASDDMTKNKESHFFLKVDTNKVDTVIAGLNQQVWNHKNTVGPRTVSRFDLNPIINGILKENC